MFYASLPKAEDMPCESRVYMSLIDKAIRINNTIEDFKTHFLSIFEIAQADVATFVHCRSRLAEFSSWEAVNFGFSETRTTFI